MDFELAEALWTLGVLPIERLPAIAAAALDRGVESTSMALLAGLQAHELDEAPAMFQRSLRELGRNTPTMRDAIYTVAKVISAEIVRNNVKPYEGAKQIWQAALQFDDPTFHDVDGFIYAASEYEDRPPDREHFASEIRREAVRWAQLDSHN